MQEKQLHTKYTKSLRYSSGVLGKNVGDLLAELTPAVQNPRSTMNPSESQPIVPVEFSQAAEDPHITMKPSDEEAVPFAEFKEKLLTSLNNRYAITETLWFEVGQDNRIFIYFDHTLRTSFTLMFSSLVFETLVPDELGSEANPEFYSNDSV